ncbi:MAG: response regulator [Rhodococcus sp. (in: high G+C Gram-positive bacteria)]
MHRTALVVDDDAVTRLVLCHMLRNLGWTVDQAADTTEAVDRIATSDHDLVISDFHLPSGTGIDVLEAAERQDEPPPFVLVTGIIEYSSLPSDISSRLADQLTKPVGSDVLRRTLDRLFPTAAT